jgi:hypothetical protein
MISIYKLPNEQSDTLGEDNIKGLNWKKDERLYKTVLLKNALRNTPPETSPEYTKWDDYIGGYYEKHYEGLKDKIEQMEYAEIEYNRAIQDINNESPF